MAFHAYMLKSESSGRHYYGHTGDLEKRLISHNSTQKRYTRGKGPWGLAGDKTCATKGEAMKIEQKLKRMKTSLNARGWNITTARREALRW